MKQNFEDLFNVVMARLILKQEFLFRQFPSHDRDRRVIIPGKVF